MEVIYKCLLIAAIAFFTSKVSAQNEGNSTKEAIGKICDGLPASQKPVIAVMPFKIAVGGIAPEVGTGFPDMLVTALFNTGCFRIVDRDRLKEVMGEQGLGQSGAGDESFAQAGKLSGAQVLVFGTITEFNEHAGGTSAAGGVLGKLVGSKTGGLVSGVKTVTSSITYTLKFENPVTGEVLDSRSFTKKTTAVGLASGGVVGGGGGAAAGGASFFSSKSMQKALEESLNEAAAYMSKNRDAYMQVLQQASNTSLGVANAGKAGCPLLSSGGGPKIMVIIPEFHISQRIPDPAAETEINRRLIEAGFHVVDPALYATLNGTIEFKDATNDPAKAISIGKQYGADIVIYGEAFSQRPEPVRGNDAGTVNGMASCRARVEVRAVRTDNAQIVATNGFEAGAVDNAEFIAAKSALRKAGGTTADYLMQQFCKNTSLPSTGANGPTDHGNTLVTLLNADYGKLRALATLLSQKYKVVSRNLAENQGLIQLETKDDPQVIADFIDDKAHLAYSIKAIGVGKIDLAAK